MSDSKSPSEKEKSPLASDEQIIPADFAIQKGPSTGDDQSENEMNDRDSADAGKGRIAALEAQLVETTAELNKFRDLALRSSADLDNYRKRMSKEREEAIRFANSGLLEKLIPVLDNFEFGLQAARGASSADSILDGMKMVQKQFQDFLSSAGIEVIDATGQKFDPQLHEAISQEENDKIPEGVVLRQLRKGYKLRDRLIRPANVVVSKGVPVEASTGPRET
jgi:molecular chaperone GrpE